MQSVYVPPLTEAEQVKTAISTLIHQLSGFHAKGKIVDVTTSKSPDGESLVVSFVVVK